MRNMWVYVCVLCACLMNVVYVFLIRNDNDPWHADNSSEKLNGNIWKSVYTIRECSKNKKRKIIKRTKKKKEKKESEIDIYDYSTSSYVDENTGWL